MGNRIQIIALIFTMLMSSCRKEAREDCFGKLNETTTQQRYAPDFHTLQIGEKFDVTLVSDSVRAGEVMLEGPENVLDAVSVSVEGSLLRITDKNKCQWVRQVGLRLKVTLYMRPATLDSIYTEGSATIRCENPQEGLSYLKHQSVGTVSLDVKSSYLVIEHWEAGTVNVTGEIAIFIPVIHNTGILDAREAKSDYVFVYHYGLNDVHVKPFKSLYSYFNNSGNIYYYRDPVEEMRTFNNGKGRLIKAF